MKVIDTFAIVEEHLYSVQYDNQEVDEWQRLFNLWLEDTDYLRSFFEEHKEDLLYGYYKGITIDEAIKKTKREAKYLQGEILKFATDKENSLSGLFKPLDNRISFNPKSNQYSSNNSYEKNKSRQHWLRIYAIRIDHNLFVVSGGAIKLTEKMDRPHLVMELEKLELTRNFLIDRDDDLETFELF